MKNNRLNIGKAAKYLEVSIDTLRRWDKNGKLCARKSEGGHRYYFQTDLDLYKQDIFALATNWILGSPVEPPSEYYCPTSIEFKGRLSNLKAMLEREKVPKNYFPLIVAIVGEIGNNSYDHNLGNWPDTSGIFFAFDIKKKQITLADRGVGVFRTLKRVKPSIKNDEDALKTAFTEVLSGRAPESRGNGLKFVQKVILDSPMKLAFYSGNARADLNDKLKFSKIDIYYSGCLALVTI